MWDDLVAANITTSGRIYDGSLPHARVNNCRSFQRTRTQFYRKEFILPHRFGYSQ
jgi:hypothetical protein